MATERLKTIKASGGDYTSLLAAEAGEDDLGDLVTRDEWMHFLCYVLGDAGVITFEGWTTDSTRYILIDTPSSDRHTGKWDDTKYRLTSSARNSFGITLSEDYIQIVGLQIELTSSEAAGAENGIIVNNTGCGISKCIVRRTGTFSGNGINFHNAPSGSSVYVWNNLAIGFPYLFYDSQRYSAITRAGAIYNNTLIDGNVYVRYNTGNAANLAMRNNLVQYAGGNDYTVNNIGSTSRNISDDTSSPDSSYREIRVSFTNADGGDYSLASGETDALGAGGNLSADGTLSFTDDIAGTVRPEVVPWCIGAYEYSLPTRYACRMGSRFTRRLR